jgi:DNA-binding response OmpR family regulator
MSAKRLLIVEDHPRTLHALGRFFRVMGFEVVMAGTLTEALALLVPPPDCLILDLGLPDGDGEQLLRRVRELNLRTHVAICTGIHEQERLESLKELAPNALLLKPIDLDTIFNTYSPMVE